MKGKREHKSSKQNQLQSTIPTENYKTVTKLHTKHALYPLH